MIQLLLLTLLSGDEGIDWDKEREFWAFRPLAARPTRPIDAHLPDSPGAEKRALIRRVSYDLTGLPPVPVDVEAFLKDNDPASYEQVADRLLASPRFGERFASLWLPLARYAEDQAHQVGDDTKHSYPNAFRYRDWIIDSFNRDRPYDEFIRLQLAADRIKGVSPSDLAALGFIGLGPKYYARSRLDVKAEEWADRVDTVTRGLLGLTVECARCHDHKHEPITMGDYYALAGVFASTQLVNRSPDGKTTTQGPKGKKQPTDTIHVVRDEAPKDLHVFLRGNVEHKGELAPRRFLRILSPGEPARFTRGSGRQELADAIADPANPLTARVMVNRIWGFLFGRHLVPTPSNFGRSGRPPIHPELLDDLSIRFVRNGWSIKKLVREIVLSSAYRRRANPRRLSAEQFRDAVLFVSGRLDWKGGRSMKLHDPANRRTQNETASDHTHSHSHTDARPRGAPTI